MTFAKTDNTAPQQTPPTRKRIRWWLILSFFAIPIMAIALVVFAIRVAYTLRENQGRRLMAAELEKLAAEGYPIDNAMLSDLYSQRTSDTRVFEWSALFVQLGSGEFSTSSAGVPALVRTIDINNGEDDYDIYPKWSHADACIRFANEQQEWISLAQELAVEDVPVYFPIAFRSSATLLPEVQATRTIALMLATDAQVAIHIRDAPRALRNIVALVELSKHPDAVPFAVSRLVGIAVRRLAMRCLQAAIRYDLFDEQQLLEIDAVLTKHCDIGQRWQTMVVEDMLTNLPVFLHPGRAMDRSTVKNARRQSMPARGHDAVYFMGLMRRAMAVPQDDFLALYRAAVGLGICGASLVESVRLKSSDRESSRLQAKLVAAERGES